MHYEIDGQECTLLEDTYQNGDVYQAEAYIDGDRSNTVLLEWSIIFPGCEDSNEACDWDSPQIAL